MNPITALTSRLLLALCCAVVATPGSADPQSKSYSNWNLEAGNVAGVFTIAAREVTRLPGYKSNVHMGKLLQQHLHQVVYPEVAGQRCEQRGSHIERARQGYIRVAMRWHCPQNQQALQLTINAFFAQAPSHIHFARFHINAQPVFERLFTRRQGQHQLSWYVDPETATDSMPAGQTVLVYTQFGFEHILIGLDHIAFLLALLLLASRPRDIVLIVTGFTLGHSITLSLTVLGLATPRLMVVEAFIGFTIAMVAIENVAAQQSLQKKAALIVASCLVALALWNDWSGSGQPVLAMWGLALFSFCYINLSTSAERARQLRPAITTLFGLIHGFGFASVLLEVGLPGNAVLPALFGFNLGVELGQIAIVFGLACMGVMAQKILPRAAGNGGALMNATLCGLGSYWFVQRLYF